MARQVWDESRHAEIFIKLLDYVGSYLGEYPETRCCGRARKSTTPRVAWRESIATSRASPATSSTRCIRLAQRAGDAVIERAIDYVLADEITHVRMGSKRMLKLREGDPERLKRAQEFQKQYPQSL